MIFEQFERLTRDRTVKATIGMSRDKFDALVPAFASSYDFTQQNRIDNNEIKYVQKGGSHGVLDTPEKRLFFILYYLKTYPTFDVLGFHFDLSAGHAHDYVVFFLPILQHALERLNVAPERTIDSNSDLQQLIDKYDKVVIDGLEVPCVRPIDNEAQEDRYSGKKKRHTVKSLAISTEQRHVLYLSSIYGGHTHDYTMLKDSFPPADFCFTNAAVLADLGFVGASNDYCTYSDIRLPHKKPRKSKNNPSPQLTEQQKKENRSHSRRRIVVEHAIGGMKDFFCIANRVRNQSIELIDQFLGVSAGLWNFKIS